MHKMKKRALFVFTWNQYDVVFEMMKQIAWYLESAMGYEVGYCGVGEDYQKKRLEEWEFIFSTQGAEFAFLPEVDNKKHFTWLCDHPMHVLARFVEYQDKKNVYIGCVDRSHVEYLNRYYGIEKGCYIPHFGWKAEKCIPYEQRSIDIFFPATYTDWEMEVKPRYEGLEGPLQVITEKVIEYMRESPLTNIESAFDIVLRSFGEIETDGLVRECMEFVGEYVDSYWRCLHRKRIVLALLEAGMHLTVCGRGWNRLKAESDYGDNLQILAEEMPYVETIEKIADSKMVLNIMPGFKEGLHERVAMATMNGAVCFTDRSIHMSTLFEANEGVVFYDVKKPEELVQKIKRLQAHPQEAMRVAKNGQDIAEKELTVKNFVNSMLGMLENNRYNN